MDITMKKKLRIQHYQIDLENGMVSYYIITEIVNNVPVATYRYKIPVDYLITNLKYESIEKYFPLCPN